MGYFKQIDANIKKSLQKPEGSNLTRSDLIIRLHHAHNAARAADLEARQTYRPGDKNKLIAITKDYIDIAEKYFLKLVR